MEKAPLLVAVTGAAGQIGYSFVPLLASGSIFGLEQPIHLRMLDIEPCMESLKGLSMELLDSAYPLLKKVEYGFNAKEMLKDIDVGVFIGGFPRKAGMERKELLSINAKIFKEQGEALNEVGKPTTKCLVVANPANTNCLLLSSFAPKIPKKNFSCMTRLDHNRALAQVATKAGVPVETVKNVIIWGNHSVTQYPDVTHGVVGDKPIMEVVKDEAYFKGDFMTTVQKRGAAIIAARKASSALSAAKAAADHLKTWYFGTKDGEWVSMGVLTEGNKYGVDANLCFSFPCKCKGFDYEIVDGFTWTEFDKEKIAATEKELKEERLEALGK